MSIRNWIILATLAMILTGCRNTQSPLTATQQERQNFTTVAEKLDAGGSFYAIYTPQNLFAATKRLIKSSEQQLIISELPDQRQRQIQAVLSTLQVVFNSGGGADLRAVGKSSVRAGEMSGVPFFRNRSFIHLTASPRGWFWQLPGATARLLLQEIAELPQETEFAADFEVNFRPLGQLGKELIPNYQLVDDLAKNFTGLNFHDLLEQLSGEWGIVFLADESGLAAERSSSGLVVCPDRQGKLFERLVYFAKFVSNFKVYGDTIELGFPEFGNLKLLVIRGKDQLIIAESSTVWEQFRNPQKTLRDSPQFRQLSAQLPAKGSAIIYCNNQKQSNYWELPGLTIDLSSFSALPELTVVQHTPKGWLVTEHSGCDYNMQYFANFVILPAMAASELWENFGRQLQKKLLSSNRKASEKTPPQSVAPAISRPTPRPANTPQLLNQELQTATQLLPKLRQQRPAKIAALKSHLYWFTPISVPSGEAENSGKIPEVLLHHPDTNQQIGVIYRDGKSETLAWEGKFSAKRAVSLLQTRHQYPEAVFLALIRQATILDNALMDKK